MKYLQRKTGTGKHHLLKPDGSLYCKMVLGKRYIEVYLPDTPRCHMCNNNWLKENRPNVRRHRRRR